MTVTWNVRDETGTLVDSLDRLAAVLLTSPTVAAKALLDDSTLFDAAPAALRTEAKEHKGREKGGGDTPPVISNGSFVSWSGGKGRVDLIVTNGKVPGVEDDVEGTEKSPAARVVVYEDGKASGKKIGASTHTLRRIPPISTPKKGASPAALVQMLAEHESKCDDLQLPAHTHVTGFAVKAVYDRGLDAYPGAEVTTMTAQEWAIGRVEHFVKVAAGDIAPNGAGNDTDLLAPEHPLHTPTLTRADPPPATTKAAPPAAPPADAVVVDRAEIEAQIKALLD